MQKRRFVFKPIHFILLIAIDLCVLAGVLIPQRSKLESAKEELAQKTEQLNALKIEYEREIDSLEYMKTDAYKLQQGSIKYGWHYQEDTIIPDDAAAIVATPAPTQDTATPEAADPTPDDAATPETTDDGGTPGDG